MGKESEKKEAYIKGKVYVFFYSSLKGRLMQLKFTSDCLFVLPAIENPSVIHAYTPHVVTAF